MIECSLGICVYNEEKNIEIFLDSLLKQKLKRVSVDEILVVISGSTDNTYKIVKKYSLKHKKIKILHQKRREGKASAVNLFVKKAKNEVLVLLGGDIILAINTIENLVSKFRNEQTGMTGVRPVPLNDINDGLTGFAAHLLWDLHHRVSLVHPKMGEVVAFRKIFRRIPIMSSVDEANIEPLIRGQSYKIVYVPKAKIYNKAPTTIEDFIRQRRRIYSGHLAVKYEQSYQVSTLDLEMIFKELFFFLRENFKLKFILYTPVVILLESYSRFLGWWDYKIAKKRHTVWQTIETTKQIS